MIDLHFDLLKLGPWVRSELIVVDAMSDLAGAPGRAVVVSPALELVASLFNKDWPLSVPTGLRAQMWDRLWPSESRLTGRDGRRSGQRRQW